jgi:hypothetical protein
MYDEYGLREEIKRKLREVMKIQNRSALEDMANYCLHTIDDMGKRGHYDGLRRSFGTGYAIKIIIKEIYEK